MASVSYTQGPQTAALLAVAYYYLACSGMNATVDRMEQLDPEFNKDAKAVSEKRKSVRDWIWTVGMMTSFTVCLPATAMNAGLIYIFTDCDQN